MPRPKRQSRAARWAESVAVARKALDEARAAAEAAVSALAEVKSIQEEFEEWKDNVSENLQSSAMYEKLEAVCEIDLEPDDADLNQIEEAIDACENAELPLGFGRD